MSQFKTIVTNEGSYNNWKIILYCYYNNLQSISNDKYSTVSPFFGVLYNPKINFKNFNASKSLLLNIFPYPLSLKYKKKHFEVV